MNFWWVNQNKTHKEEYEGEFMWSPQRNRNGAYNQFYKNMLKVEVGDIVYSFKKQIISKYGIVISLAYNARKPNTFKEKGSGWDKNGWMVKVKWFDTPNIVKPKEIIAELSPYLPSKYSPVSKDGNGLQSVYLAYVPSDMSNILNTYLGLENTELLEQYSDIETTLSSFSVESDLESKVILHDPDKPLSHTEAMIIHKARRGQGTFRKNVESIENFCRVTGVMDKEILIASHMKPWRLCENSNERLDGNNGLLLTPTVDYLFDKGFISFMDNGDMLLSDALDRTTFDKLGIQMNNVGSFNPKQKEYLSFHRENIFKG